MNINVCLMKHKFKQSCPIENLVHIITENKLLLKRVEDKQFFFFLMPMYFNTNTQFVCLFIFQK